MSFARRRLPATMMAAASLALVACDDSENGKAGRAESAREQQQAQTAPPPKTDTTPTTPRATPTQPPAATPGASPTAARLVGTWTVTEFKGGPADGRSDRSETTTYRFEEGGRVTVAGSKQCAYAFQDMELKVDCHGQLTTGKIEFRGDQTVLWNIGPNQIVTLTKR